MKSSLLLLLTLFLFCNVYPQKDDKNYPKLTSEEIVSKHVASIGKPEAILSVKSRVLVGLGTFTMRLNPGKIGGPAQVASDGEMFLLAMLLNASDYPSEKLAFDGKDLTAAVLPGGGRSELGDFIKRNPQVIKRGLFGGVLRENWPLLKSDKDVKLEAVGMSKVGDRNLYKIRCSSSGFGEMTVSLFFDPETFRHVRTEYSYLTGQITAPNPNRVGLDDTAPRKYFLSEDFSNFAKADDLILPLKYVVEFSTDAGKPLIWTMNFSQVFNNPPVDRSAFKVS